MRPPFEQGLQLCATWGTLSDLSMQRIDALYSVENARRIFAENGGLFELDGVSAPKYKAEGNRTRWPILR